MAKYHVGRADDRRFLENPDDRFVYMNARVRREDREMIIELGDGNMSLGLRNLCSIGRKAIELREALKNASQENQRKVVTDVGKSRVDGKRLRAEPESSAEPEPVGVGGEPGLYEGA